MLAGEGHLFTRIPDLLNSQPLLQLDYTATDRHSQALEAAQAQLQQWGIGQSQWDPEGPAPSSLGAADLLVCNCTLANLGDPASALGNMAAALKEGGFLLLHVLLRGHTLGETLAFLAAAEPQQGPSLLTQVGSGQAGRAGGVPGRRTHTRFRPAGRVGEADGQGHPAACGRQDLVLRLRSLPVPPASPTPQPHFPAGGRRHLPLGGPSEGLDLGTGPHPTRPRSHRGQPRCFVLQDILAEDLPRPVWLTAMSCPTSGVVGLVNCLRKEPGGHRIR